MSDLSLVSPDVKSVPYSGHLLCFSLSFFNSVLFFFGGGERSELARSFPNSGPSWMCVLMFCFFLVSLICHLNLH